MYICDYACENQSYLIFNFFKVVRSIDNFSAVLLAKLIKLSTLVLPRYHILLDSSAEKRAVEHKCVVKLEI